MNEINPYQPPSTDQAPIGSASSELGLYVPGGGKATAAVVTLYISAVAYLLGLGAEIHRLVTLGRIRSGTAGMSEAELTDLLNTGAVLMQLGAQLACAIAFCIWFHHAYRNMGYLGEMRSHAVGWAPGSFFVPILNLYRPYQIAKEIWHASAPLEEAYSGVVPHGPVSRWWALWLIGNIISNGANRMMRPGSMESIQTATIVMVVADVLIIGAAFAAVHLVKGIEERQAARHRATHQTAGPGLAAAPVFPPV